MGFLQVLQVFQVFVSLMVELRVAVVTARE